jgi:hypothetical protein
MSEVQLAAAVIHRALEDATTPDERLAKPRIIQTPTGRRQVYTPGLKAREREAAIRFLLDDDRQGWASARDAWCEQADVDPLTLRRRALRLIPLDSIPTELRGRLVVPAAPATASHFGGAIAHFVARRTPTALEVA